MKILIKVYYETAGVSALQRGPWPVNPKQFRDSPDIAAVIGALDFIQWIRRNNAHPIKVTKVLYGDDIDITDKVLNVK